jgi:tape measure domain-containing protein
VAGQEVGVAYYSLLPSGKGFGKAVENELGAAADGHEKKQRSLWSKVAKYGAIAAAAIGTLFTAKILSGGLSRALNIEDAQAKLKGLGHDAETITAIMGDALAAVKGTAFGLDQAATIAAAAVAAGIKPGQQLERYLKLTADAATIAGSSLSEMGSILNKVTGSGKAYNDSLQQLADRGIPIYQWLAEELGTTTDAVFKLASQGKISAEQFQSAIEKNIAGAALSSGETTRGAFANMQSAMSRWGAALLTDVLPFAKDFFGEMIVIFDGLNERSSGLIAPFTDWLKNLEIEGMGDRFLGWLDNLDLSSLTDTLDALQPVFQVLRDLGPEIATLAPSLKDLLIAILPLVPKLVDLLVKAAPLITKIMEAIVPVVGWIADNLGGMFDAIGLITDYIDDADYGKLTQGLRDIEGAFGDFLDVGLKIGETIGAKVGVFLYDMRQAKDAALNVVQGLLDAWDSIGQTVGDGLRVVVGFFTGNSELIEDGMTGLQERLGGIWTAIRTFAENAANTLWANVKAAFTTGVAFVQSIPDRLVAFFTGLPDRLRGIGRDLVQGLINGIVSMASSAVRSVTNLSESMLSGMKSWLGIKSPSRVFRDEVGAQIGAGVVAGIDGMRVQTDTAIRSLVSVPTIEPMGGAQVEINANGVDPMTTALLVKRELGALLAVH